METTKARLTRWALISILGGAILLVSFALDPAVQNWIAHHQNNELQKLMRGVSRYGDWAEHVAVGFVLFGIAWSRKSKRWMRIALAMLLACAIAGAVARVVKVSTGRARPSFHTAEAWSGPSLESRLNAFPSGHTAASAAFFGSLAFASWRIGAPFLIVPLLIAFSRIYVAAHHLSDVTAAAFLGVLIAYLVTPSILQFQNPQKPEIQS
jgi:membrane-associated phospholipid phosphatase